MNLIKIIDALAKADPEVYARLDSRRRVFRHLSGWGKAASAAALPAVVGTLFNKAYGQGSTTRLLPGVADVLNLALQLEYLEYHFYNQALAASNLLNAADRPAIEAIRNDESGHVKTLRAALGTQAFSASDPTVAAFDFTAGGRFADVFTNAATFYAVAQSFEDTGVRAYKGAAPLTNVMANKTVLTAALNIHSVEARHASHIRSMRRAGSPLTQSTPSMGVPASPYDSAPKSWVSGTDNGGAAAPATSGIYGAGNDSGAATYGASAQTGSAAGVTFPAESNTTQGGVPLSTSTSTTFSGFPAAAFSEAFDEGLDVGTVTAIAKLFVRSGFSVF